MSKIPSVFTGVDLIQWILRTLDVDDGGRLELYDFSVSHNVHRDSRGASFGQFHVVARIRKTLAAMMLLKCNGFHSLVDSTHRGSCADGEERRHVLSSSDTLLLAVEPWRT